MASQQAPKPEHKKISQIKSSLLRPALTSHFEVYIAPLPDFVEKPNNVDLGQLYLQCSEASLPGSSLATFEINNDFHGVTERHAYRRIFDERIDLTFYVDASNYLPIRIFESWIGGIVNGNTQQEVSNSNYYYTTLYPKDYRAKIYITKFERSYTQGDSNIRYTFLDAFPISISAMPVSYDSSNLLKCTVGFTYLRYFTGAAESGSPAPDAGGAMDGGGSLPTGNPEFNKPEIIQNTGPQGEGLYDSATGQLLLSTVDQIATQGKVGDGVTPALAKELQNFANGT